MDVYDSSGVRHLSVGRPPGKTHPAMKGCHVVYCLQSTFCLLAPTPKDTFQPEERKDCPLCFPPEKKE